jgi:hypothetical protein
MKTPKFYFKANHIAYKLGQAIIYLKKAEKILEDCEVAEYALLQSFGVIFDHCQKKIMNLKEKQNDNDC